jgi:hypothetical protein
VPDNFITLFIIMLVVARIIGAITKAGKQPGQRPGQQPGVPPQQPQQRLPDTSRSQAPQPAQQPRQAPQPYSAENPATEMIPAELWELLTGQKRPAPAQTPPPAPKPVSARIDLEEDEESVTADEERVAPRRVRDEGAEVELVLRRQRAGLEKRVERRPEPAIVSLETEPLAEPVRHKKYHEKMAVATVAERVNTKFAASVRLNLATPNDLRRAVVLQEILGKPKALE